MFGAVTFGCGGPEKDAKSSLPNVSKAAPYRVLGEKTWSLMNAERGTVFISSPGAVGFEERAHTVMKAALDLSEQYKLDDTEVMLASDERLLERGTQYARAVYRKGKAKLPGQDAWTVTSSDDVLTEKELAIAKLWYENSDRFENKEGYTDHERLNRFIAKQMNMRAEEVELPAPMTRPYEPKYQ